MALDLVLLMRTKLIPKQFRLDNFKLAMRATLALWTVLVLLGIGIYAERYLMQSVAASARSLESASWAPISTSTPWNWRMR